MANKGTQDARSGRVEWTCPSNIALIKYWGKAPGQMPLNPSLSMTLQEATTSTAVSYDYVPGLGNRSMEFSFEGKREPAFEARVSGYLENLLPLLPFLADTRLTIDSSNTFPHSSGIASSASAMGALALCLVQMEEEMQGEGGSESFLRKASRLARLGSGSASRSLYPKFALWGKHPLWENSSDEYSIPLEGFHGTFQNLHDAILVVDPSRKRISSSKGHALMGNNPYGKIRFMHARDNLEALNAALRDGHWPAFVDIIENEALTLHAMMMTSLPGYLLLQPGTLSIIQLIREFREGTRCRLGFTLDAGANVHLLYSGEDAKQVESFIGSHLVRYCENELVIMDRMGAGPKKSGL